MASGSLFAQQSTITQPAASSETTSTIKVDAQNSKFGFLAVSGIEVSANDVRDRGSRAAMSTLNAIGLTYKPNEDTKWGLRQYFTYLSDVDKGNQFEVANPTITYSNKIKSLLGSDEFSPLLWYYIPTSDTSRTEKSNGKLRFTAYVNWTLNPRWTATYFLDPRQTLNPQTELSFSKTTWIHGGSLAYNFNDKISVYQGVGTTHEWKTSEFKLNEESIDISTGMYITAGPVLLIPDITNSIPTKSGGQTPKTKKAVSTLYRAEEIKYSLSIIASF